MRSLVLLTLTVPLIVPMGGSSARADVPTLLSFQGVLKSPSGTPIQGAQSVRFSIYNGPTGNQGVANEIATIGGAGSTVSLLYRPVAAGSETVMKSDGSATYTRGSAYTIDNANGTITNVSIPANTTLKISYQWVPTAFWTEEQTVQANNGLFAALLGVNVSIPYAAFMGSEWLQVEVRTPTGAFEAMNPRQRLAAAPYALRVASVEGADGGAINGNIDASGTVSGTGSSYQVGHPPFSFNIKAPGLQGMGFDGAGGDAPGVLAIGSGAGTGLALEARGSMTTTGDVTAGANLRVKGTTTTEGANLTYGNGQVSGLLTVGNLTAAGNVTAGLDVSAGQDLKATRNLIALGTGDVTGSMVVGGSATLKGSTAVWKGMTVAEGLEVGGSIYTNLDLTVNKLLEARGNADFKRDVLVERQLTVNGPLRVNDEISTPMHMRSGGRIYALGMPRPDYDGTMNVGTFDFEKSMALPTALGSDITQWVWETYITEYGEGGGVITERVIIPSDAENLRFYITRVTSGSVSTVTFTTKKGLTDARTYNIKLRIWKINL